MDSTSLAAIGGWLGWFLGGADGFLYALIAFVVIDYITGVMCAIVDHKLSSEVGFKGIFKKVLIFMMVGIGNIIDTKYSQATGCCVLRSSSSICSNEGVSMLENAGHLGLPIPAKLKDILVQLHDRSEDK
jgi:toxin secretion/phage lysis holin